MWLTTPSKVQRRHKDIEKQASPSQLLVTTSWGSKQLALPFGNSSTTSCDKLPLDSLLLIPWWNIGDAFSIEKSMFWGVDPPLDFCWPLHFSFIVGDTYEKQTRLTHASGAEVRHSCASCAKSAAVGGVRSVTYIMIIKQVTIINSRWCLNGQKNLYLHVTLSHCYK